MPMRIGLSDGVVRIEVDPAIGRLMTLERVDAEHAPLLADNREEAESLGPTSWLNYGGDWLWPVRQQDWPLWGVPKKWPPPPDFAGKAWELKMGPRTHPYIELQLEIGAPLHIRVLRRFHFDPEAPGDLIVDQSIKRIAPSAIPVCLWQVAQLRAVEQIRVERLPDPDFPEPLAHLYGTEDPLPSLVQANEMVIYRTGAVSTKLGSNGSWIEAWNDQLGLRIELEEQAGLEPLPLVLFEASDHSYIEIETLSIRSELPVGESIRNRLRYRILEAND